MIRYYLIDSIGIVGVIIVLIAYYLLNISKISALDLSYQLMNFFGSCLILFSLFFNWNLPAGLIEISWMLISLIGVYRCWKIKYSVSI